MSNIGGEFRDVDDCEGFVVHVGVGNDLSKFQKISEEYLKKVQGPKRSKRKPVIYYGNMLNIDLIQFVMDL